MQPDRQRTPRALLTAVFVGIIIWAALIAVGVFHRSGGNWAKTSIVVFVVAVFLGGWLFVLKRRPRPRQK
jgi:Kef-type K+ transport system membrane component KefB